MFYILHNSVHLPFNNEPRGLKMMVMFRLKVTLEHASDTMNGIVCVCMCVCSTTHFKFV
jgi:hypothetical protein